MNLFSRALSRIPILLALLLAAAAARAGSPAAAYRGADPQLLTQVRENFEAATESVPVARHLTVLLDARLPPERESWPAVFRAFRAALEGVHGKHSHLPWVKYRHVRSALAQFRGLVEAHPEAVELRMLRYSFCSQLPEVFGMGPQAAADLPVLVAQLERNADPMVTDVFRRKAAEWILKHGAPPPDLRARLAGLLDI